MCGVYVCVCVCVCLCVCVCVCVCCLPSAPCRWFRQSNSSNVFRFKSFFLFVNVLHYFPPISHMPKVKCSPSPWAWGGMSAR